MGGVFNPPHYGHLMAAESARESQELDKVLFIPSGNPPHKEMIELADGEYRYGMVQQAIKGNPWFEASRIEIDREGRTYSVDTLSELIRIYGSEAAFYYIIGADNVNELVTWKDYRKLFSMCEFIAVTRPGFDISSHSKTVESMISTNELRIHFLRTPMLEISSSEIRERLAGGRSIRYMTPSGVEEYIKDNRLYNWE
jgi:nicotinate-nucleotide adenylyltransferase